MVGGCSGIRMFGMTWPHSGLLFPTHVVPIDSRTTHNRWRAYAFVQLLTSSPLIKIGIIYTQLLQEERFFQRNSQQNFLPLHVATPWQKLPTLMMLSH